MNHCIHIWTGEWFAYIFYMHSPMYILFKFVQCLFLFQSYNLLHIAMVTQSICRRVTDQRCFAKWKYLQCSHYPICFPSLFHSFQVQSDRFLAMTACVDTTALLVILLQKSVQAISCSGLNDVDNFAPTVMDTASDSTSGNSSMCSKLVDVAKLSSLLSGALTTI